MVENKQRVTFRPLERLDGSSEFVEFLDSLPDKEADKLLAVIKKTEQHGLLVARSQKWIKKLDHDLYELRAKVGSNIQRALYFQKVGNDYLITHGFTKKSDKTPKLEVQHAENMKAKYQRGELK